MQKNLGGRAVIYRWAQHHCKEEGRAIIDARFDVLKPEATCNALATFINYYDSRRRLYRVGSIFARFVAVLAGVIGLMLLNPLALGLAPEAVASSLDGSDSVLWAGIVAITAGGVLTMDFAFGFTRKHMNWNVTMFDLLAEKAEFRAAFSERFLAKSSAELTTKLFEEARILSMDTIHEFTVKRVEESRLWAQDVQSVMQTLIKSNQALQTSAQTAGRARASLLHSSFVWRQSNYRCHSCRS